MTKQEAFELVVQTLEELVPLHSDHDSLVGPDGLG